MTEPLTLMAVHAHPDDEAIGTGGVFARYVAEGTRTVLVTCTRGEVGEISDPSLATPENLAEVREQELREACRILGIGELYFLGYRDSGMAGTPENDDPACFWQANLDEATGRLVELVRRCRPDVLITYDERGFYGHPDHIQANRITLAAFDAAGDPARYPGQGLAPWTPRKLYYNAVPRSRLVEFGRRLREAGIESPFEGDAGPPIGTPDEQITTVVDVAAYVDLKRRALLVHRTQMGPDGFFSKMPDSFFQEAFGHEAFVRVESRVPVPDFETDLFAGLARAWGLGVRGRSHSPTPSP